MRSPQKFDFIFFENSDELLKMATQVLEDVKNGKITIEQAQEMLEKLKISGEVTYKVSPKGALSFYGLRRMPITVYIEELQKIVEVFNSEAFQKFMTDNKSKLSTKESKTKK